MERIVIKLKRNIFGELIRWKNSRKRKTAMFKAAGLMSLCMGVMMMSVFARAESTTTAESGEQHTEYAEEYGDEDVTVTSENEKYLGTSIIANPTGVTNVRDEWLGSFVYFGTYDNNPIKYRVLSKNTTDFGGATMLLDCDSILWNDNFDDDSCIWNSSYIKQYLNSEGPYTNGGFLTDSFTALEQDAIAESTKADVSSTDGSEEVSRFYYVPLNGEQVFLLDLAEATNADYGYYDDGGSALDRRKTDNIYGEWWLRSSYPDYDNLVHSVDFYGRIYGSEGDGNSDSESPYKDCMGVSPALNVDLSAVLFTSVLTGAAGETGAEYKLTLRDEDMTITPGKLIRYADDEVTVPYIISGTNAGNATQVSLMVLDDEYVPGNINDATLVAYVKLADAGAADGTFIMTDNMLTGSYYYYIVAEDGNSGYATDYASAPVQITIPDAVAYFKKDVVPKTGERTPVVWLFALMVLSGAGLLLLRSDTGVKKRHRDE